jgi:hypothetical protein
LSSAKPLASEVSISVLRELHLKHVKAAAKSLASLAGPMNEQEEIRILFFCCEGCAEDHVVSGVKRGIQLLGEQL